jgi:3-oxoacyl-[acyl-carrier protein] reductase
MSADYQGKIVVVTGGSRGIGRTIAVAFAREGAQTVLASSSADNLAAAAKTVTQAGGPAPLTVAGDLRELKGCQQLFNQVNERFKRCDVLINNAGATRAGNFLDQSEELWLDGFALKFFGCVRLSKLFWPLLKAAQGHIVNVIGGAARTPGAQFLIGGSVNAAMGNFAKGLAALGKQDGVNVNSIHPGMTETERTIQLHQQMAAASGKTPEQIQAEHIARQGIRRLGKPEDVAALTLFLCSEGARHIQGTAIAVDGGATPGYY